MRIGSSAGVRYAGIPITSFLTVDLMANSLKDQLMKTGLVDKKRAHQVRQQRKQEEKMLRRGELEADDSAERIRQQRAEQVERDRQLEAQRQAERQTREIAAQIRQMIVTSRIDRSGGDVAYQFVQDRKIKKAYVTQTQYEQLVLGRIAIVALGEGYELVPAKIAEKISQRDPGAILLLNTQSQAAAQSAEAADEDPYADYPIPDDLMW